MKKIIALLVACVLLAGCGQADKKIPEDMSEEAYDTGCKMIEVMMKAGYPFCSTSSFSGAPGSSRSVGFRGLK